ncbi:uncharacterized protein C8Q71DRAFT_765731 [Rhodofomes roseus]|uniref:Secreted protein n=1 Tax=Rhodofomes roseus TaxID=34475 RepID=A0ABQ8KDI5_9APHY|nr:uncharacterized protein C8Q71DRAFT_765731 [Rhodofomes roseus]KAH9835405.1 hypothetical protein C8Q71DRAFT_765731 [Rhodofomes roseus]
MFFIAVSCLSHLLQYSRTVSTRSAPSSSMIVYTSYPNLLSQGVQLMHNCSRPTEPWLIRVNHHGLTLNNVGGEQRTLSARRRGVYLYQACLSTAPLRQHLSASQ